jgi:hypothetical protein
VPETVKKCLNANTAITKRANHTLYLRRMILRQPWQPALYLDRQQVAAQAVAVSVAVSVAACQEAAERRDDGDFGKLKIENWPFGRELG